MSNQFYTTKIDHEIDEEKIIVTTRFYDLEIQEEFADNWDCFVIDKKHENYIVNPEFEICRHRKWKETKEK